MKPKIFVGSSVEALGVAYAIQQNLEHDAEVTVWDQSIFDLTSYTLEALMKVLDEFDFGVFVFLADDIVRIRKRQFHAARDNVVFELGLFIGRLGKERSFIVVPRNQRDFHLPTDLIGLTPATFDPDRSDENLRAALGPACHAIRNAIRRLGPLERISSTYSSKTLSDNEAPGGLTETVITKPASSKRQSKRLVLVVDDDLSIKSDLFKQIQLLFEGKANVKLMQSPKEACDLINSQPNVIGCVTDIVFRHHSELGGVQVAEAAIQKNVTVIVVTGHPKKNLGIALEELRRIGHPEERILTKPVTFNQYRQFLEKVRGWILGLDA